MATDTLSLDLGQDKPYYCYLYRDPRPGVQNQPIYVGKGTNDPKRPLLRADYHWLYGYATNRFFLRVLKKIRQAGLEPIIDVLDWFSVEKDALSFEVATIARLGRRDMGLGPLLNLTDGGEGASGYIPSPEAIAKHRVNGEKLWANASPELKETMSLARALWNDAEHRLRRTENCVKGRAKRWDDPTVKASDIETIRQAQILRRDDASLKQVYYYATASHEALAIHYANVRKARQADREATGKRSAASWARPGQKEKQGATISVGQKKAYAEPRGKQRRKTASINHKKQFSDPVTRETHSKGCSSRMKADWADPVKREAMLEARRVKKAARLAAEAGETLL